MLQAAVGSEGGVRRGRAYIVCGRQCSRSSRRDPELWRAYWSSAPPRHFYLRTLARRSPPLLRLVVGLPDQV